MELNVVHALFKYHRCRAANAGNTSPDTPAYIAIVNTITSRFMCEYFMIGRTRHAKLQ